MTTHYFADQATVTIEQIESVIREQLGNADYRPSDNLRTAAMYLPNTTPPAAWVAACIRVGINQGTARNRLREVRLFQKQLGEI